RRRLRLGRLGLGWLRAKWPRDLGGGRAILGLVEAESEPLRPEIVGWARGALAGSGLFEPGWVLEWLDSRHEDVRKEGWAWFLDEPRGRDDVTGWQRLMGTPYDDVRLALVGELEARARGAEAPRFDPGGLEGGLPRRVCAAGGGGGGAPLALGVGVVERPRGGAGQAGGGRPARPAGRGAPGRPAEAPAAAGRGAPLCAGAGVAGGAGRGRPARRPRRGH